MKKKIYLDKIQNIKEIINNIKILQKQEIDIHNKYLNTNNIDTRAKLLEQINSLTTERLQYHRELDKKYLELKRNRFDLTKDVAEMYFISQITENELDNNKKHLEKLNANIFAPDGRIKPELLANQSDLEDVASSLEAFITNLKSILNMDDISYASVTSNGNQGSSGGKRKRTQRNRRRSKGRRTRRRTKKTRRGRSRRGGYQYGTNPMTKSSSNTTSSATTSSPGTTSSPMTTSSSGTSSTASYGNDDFGSGVSGKTYKKRRNGKKAVNTKRRNNKKRNCKKCNCRGKCRCKRRA